MRTCSLACLLLAPLAACAANALPPPPKNVFATTTIIAGRAEGTARELRQKGDNAILAQNWQDAVDAYEALIAGDKVSSDDPAVIFSLATAYEGIGAREKARERYREVNRRWPAEPNARSAVVRETSLDAYLEDWAALGALGEQVLGKMEPDAAEKMLGYGARGLSRALAGDEARATKDINAGLEIMDETRFGMTGQLPVAGAMLKFALGELRKLKSEKVSLNPPGSDFVLKLETRCAFLLEAQQAYADAIRSSDPYWAAMSGYRVGELYSRLHGDLMQIPSTDRAKTESDRQVFYGIMHVRYRVLLEKGVEMMDRTLALGDRTGAAPVWMDRAKASKAEMQRALATEKQVLSTYLFTEAELEKALVLLKAKAEKDAAKSSKSASSASVPVAKKK